jgi:hypothetical protein
VLSVETNLEESHNLRDQLVSLRAAMSTARFKRACKVIFASLGLRMSWNLIELYKFCLFETVELPSALMRQIHREARTAQLCRGTGAPGGIFHLARSRRRLTFYFT